MSVLKMNRPESPANGSKLCAVCRAKASQICGGCGEIAYCAKEHQKQHWSTHKTQCKPYKIVFDEKYGRCMVASKNIKPGEIIFREKAIMTGPKQGCLPCCLTCYTSLENVEEASLFRCPGCNFPFCKEKCAKSSEHSEAECLVLSKTKSRITITDMTKSHPVYQCISPLRGLLLKTTHPKLFEAFKGLEDHNNLRRQTEFWGVYQVNVVKFLHKVCELSDQFTEEEIHSACGALDVNAYEIRPPNSGQQRVLGVFPLASMMSHNCVSNMNHVIDGNYQMTVRASVPIMRGEQVFSSYALALEGTRERRALLRQSKLFECDCIRCSDPTECSTYLSALRCQKCPTGFVLPIRPLEEKETPWQCSQCSYKLTAVVVNRVVDKLKEEFEAIGPNEVEKFEGFLKRHATLVHPNHFLFTSARQSLSQLYGRDERFLLNSLTMEQLERKISICQQMLSVANIVEPGLTRIRGVTLYEMHAPMLLMARRTFEAGQCTSAEFKEKIEAVRSILSEATRILSLEDPASTEGAMGTAAVQALEQIQRWISSM
ncbi:SET domain-containing protein SmydA-8-like [Daphnia carinata]|uniref:SET domain-containing protein SmydA-8-like n=1 Tax=Daphnia carinata TaxID=120202 RepID=UPI002580D4EA|nr:SET domain-containing protein SmydA-8-like [Daphnia carinata]